MANDSLLLRLSDLEKICIDAYIFDPANRVKAYKVCKGITDDTLSMDILNNRSSSWINSERVKAYLKYKKPEKQKIKLDENTSFDKAGLLSQLEGILQTVQDNKLKADILIKIADLKGYKKESSQTEKEIIRYYLPLTCKICPFKVPKKS